MNAPRFFADPAVQYLSQILDEVKSGLIQVPHFQRPFIWKWDHRRDLLRSVRDGIPMGAIMIWRTNSIAIKCYERLGPFPIASQPNTRPYQYLLDGVQRLSTLMGALSNVPNGVHTEEEMEAIAELRVAYDLVDRDFVLTESAAELGLEASLRLLPLELILDSVALLRFQRALVDRGGDDAMIQEIDELARAFREYKVPIIPIVTEDLSFAARTFQTINSAGEPMNEAHMVHALTWSNDFSFLEQLELIKERFLGEVQWDGLPDDPIIKSLKADLELDVYKSKPKEFSDKLKSSPDAMSAVGISLKRAAQFLEQHCAVTLPEFLPYSLQIVFLQRVLFEVPEPDESQSQFLKLWFWASTFAESYAGISDDKVRDALEKLIGSVRKKTFEWPFPSIRYKTLSLRFDFRAARAKGLAIQMIDHYASQLGGTSLRELQRNGNRSLSPMFFHAEHLGKNVSSHANRFVGSQNAINELRLRLLHDGLLENEMDAHFISYEAAGEFRAGNYDEFLRLRARDIQRHELKFARVVMNTFGLRL